MGDVVQALVAKAHPWVVNGLVVAIGLLTLGGLGWTVSLALRKIQASFAKEEKFVQYLEERYTLAKYSTELWELYNQSTNVTAIAAQLLSDAAGVLHHALTGRDDSEGPVTDVSTLTAAIAYSIKHYAREVHRCAVWVPADDTPTELKIYACTAEFTDQEVRSRRLPIERSIAGTVFRTGKIRVSGKAQEEPDWDPSPNPRHRYRSVMAAPVTVGERIEAVITVDAKEENAFRPEDQEVVKLYAALASILILGERTMGLGEKEVASSDGQGQSRTRQEPAE